MGTAWYSEEFKQDAIKLVASIGQSVNSVATRSPSENLVTSAPAADTMPAISCPGTSGYVVVPNSLRARLTSVWQTPQYAMSITTSVGPTSRRSLEVGLNGSPGPTVERALTGRLRHVPLIPEVEALVEVSGLEVGGCDDGEPHADGAGECAGRHCCGLFVPVEGGLGVLQVPEDFGGVRREAGVVIEVDPRGFVAVVVLRVIQEALGGFQGLGGCPGVVLAGVSAGFDELGERQYAGHGLSPGPLEGALGHVHGLGREAAHEGLRGHGGQYVAAQLDVAARAGEAEGLDEVPLGGIVLADVEGRPARES